MNDGSGSSCSAREAFLRSLPDRSAFISHDIVLAEKINAFYPDSPYHVTNLIDLEIGIASISSSVVLFSEGVGSLAELGAFTQIPAIARRMIVLIQTHFHNEKSFVRDGPIRQLEQGNEGSVQVFDWKSQATGSAELLHESSFSYHVEDITNGIKERLAAIPNSQRFDPGDFGHRIMLVCGLIDVAGAALFTELLHMLQSLGILPTESDLPKMLFCAKSVGWIKTEKVGHQTYYLPNTVGSACDFSYKPGGVRDTVRWKRDIRESWKADDGQRNRVIRRHPRPSSQSG
jgi:hypothetical protein